MLQFVKNHQEIFGITAIIISIITLIITYYTWHSSFLLTHRPFLWVENFSYLNEQKVAISPINTVILIVLNSPAEITSGKYYYYILEGSNKETIDDQPMEKSIKYPSDRVQYTHAAKVTEDIANNLKPTEKLIRFIRAEYKWLSSSREYFFEGKWQYNKSNKTWDTIYQKAN